MAPDDAATTKIEQSAESSKISYSIEPTPIIIDDAIDLIGNDSTYQVEDAAVAAPVVEAPMIMPPPVPDDAHVALMVDEKKAAKKSAADLPEHLRTRMTKARGDAQIKEFVSLVCVVCDGGGGNTGGKPIEYRCFKDLQLHFEKEHQERGYIVCCDKRFYRKDRLMSHITNHINPDAFK